MQGTDLPLSCHPLTLQAIDKLLREHVLPTIPKLLQDEDHMPLYALKVRQQGPGE